MSQPDSRRRLAVLFWKVINPPTRPAAGLAPWWVLIETTGCRTGRKRTTPLAAGPREADGMWLIAVHGRHSSWVRNIEASPAVRLKARGRWRGGTATLHQLDPQILARFNGYAQRGPSTFGLDPLLVRVAFAEENHH